MPQRGNPVYRRKSARPRKRFSTGLLQPGQSFVFTIEPPLASHEQPVLFTPNAGDVLLTDARPNQVTVVSHTNRVAAYAVCVAPRMLVKTLTVPWGRVFADLGEAVDESGLAGKLKSLFSSSRPRR